MKMNARELLVGALVVLFATGLMLGQMGGGPHGGPGAQAPPEAGAGFQGGGEPGDHRSGRPLQSVRIIAHFLELTEQQGEAVREILDAARVDSQLLRESIRVLEEALRVEINSDDPSEAIVGALVLEIHELKGQLQELRQGVVEDIKALLDEEQLQKLEAVRHAAALQPVVHAFHDLGLIPPRPHRLGPGETAE